MTKSRKRILRMHAHNPHCHWCQRLTVLAATNRDDAATVDHTRTRYQAGYGVHRPFVLACNKCNAERNTNDPIDPVIKERHRVSRHVRNILVRLMLVSGRVLDIQGMVARVEEAYDTGASVRP